MGLGSGTLVEVLSVERDGWTDEDGREDGRVGVDGSGLGWVNW